MRNKIASNLIIVTVFTLCVLKADTTTNKEHVPKTRIQVEETETQEPTVEKLEVEVVAASDTQRNAKNSIRSEEKEKIKQEKEIKEILVKSKEMYTSTTVNLREEPNTDSHVIKVLNRNTKVVKTAEAEEWSKVTYNGNTFGYIHSDYLSDTKMGNRWNITLTDDEIILLEKIVWREAGNQCIEGQEAVAEVILNRMVDDRYPNDLYSVLSQSGQFLSWSTRNVGTPSETTKKAVSEVLEGNTNILGKSYIAFSRGGHSRHNGSIRIQDHQFCPI